ncbi:hypothetical protein RO575_15715 [Methylomonas sp. MO1]|uniref:hypothetical protein n=1 Tax=Methylomonas sp. MO1 TaxID=3073619 RepID=UPI0028A47EA3|nr:hypothetical protein [Methylomonas sp. MO1]MDT4291014.1 hypothetical protein [Methylomonas sp. MO1]
MTSHRSRNHAEHIERNLIACAPWAKERTYLFEWLCAAEFHWFFVQGLDAIRNEFIVPGVSSLLNGIEASLRVTIEHLQSQEKAPPEPSPYKVLSNNLLVRAQEMGMPIGLLAFPGEENYDEKLKSQKPNRVDVEVVRLRNNICHGNISEFINTELGPENSFFTPMSLANIADQLLAVSFDWAKGLGEYRREHGLLHYDESKKPNENPG